MMMVMMMVMVMVMMMVMMELLLMAREAGLAECRGCEAVWVVVEMGKRARVPERVTRWQDRRQAGQSRETDFLIGLLVRWLVGVSKPSDALAAHISGVVSSAIDYACM